ncbi:MAG: SirB2 family protein [Methylobacter tundripaludum]|uniref:Putative membrane protein SirB2 n=1 Tax=Methylobacter tundripaludum TaxID=173365 RepID=A0A2S6HLC4_9GAMM|nr:SirB2 family protein [Methylobacter tundripaludum]MDD4906196.1 SirB2 family protein [Methylobacter tundripaludum]PPK78153.1 putative membrane protein SirB2 [Methylobacter tundripaludum]
MIKILHLTFILLSISSFVGRVYLAEKRPELLEQKWIKIGPHIVNTLLLITGFTLVFQGSWLSGEYGWIVAKIIALLGYVGLGMVAIKSQGTLRWQAFAGALACFIYIGIVAVSKNAFFFL